MRNQKPTPQTLFPAQGTVLRPVNREAKQTLFPPVDSDALKALREALHSSICLLDTMAEAAKERGDITDWSMMSVMAEEVRAALSSQGSRSDDR